MRLLNTQRREDTVVDSVVQEQDFRRFNEDRCQRQHVMDNHEVNARRQNFGQDFNRRANAEECQNREDHPDNTGGEVVHQHLETGLNLTVYPAIKMFNRPAAQRPAIMAPRNIGMSAPTMTPIVVMAPTTPPRSPPINLPPV